MDRENSNFGHIEGSEKQAIEPSLELFSNVNSSKVANILAKIEELKTVLQQEDETVPKESTERINVFWPVLSQDVNRLELRIKSAIGFSDFITTTNSVICNSVYLGYFCILPEEVVFQIFALLTAQEIVSCSSVCKDWYKMASDDRLFRILCNRHNFTMEKPPTRSWKWIYQSHSIIYKEKPKEGNGMYDLSDDRGRYVGDWSNYLRHGYGVQQWNDGSTYEGEWFEDKRDGHGTMTWADGQKYIGQWKNSRKEGKGTEVWPDGRKYVGEYINSNMHGYGTYYWPGGDYYIGQWQEDYMHGQGSYYWPNGSKYDGEWALDGHCGYGVYTCPTGESYQGEWKNNMRHGRGIEKYADYTYDGEWGCNRKHGKGVFYWTNDTDYYVGVWSNGKKCGLGLFVSNGIVYQQDWLLTTDETPPPIDEIDKGLEKNVELCSEEELKSLEHNHPIEIDIDKFLKRKRVRDEEELHQKQSKKKKSLHSTK